MRTRRQTFRTALTVAALGAGALIAGAASAQTVKIGLIGSTTGPHSGFDLPANEGVRMAVQEINAKGGVKAGGKTFKLQVVEEDAQSKPEIAVSGAQRLLRDDDIRVMFGIMTSGPGMPVATAFQKAKVMYFGAFTLMDTLVGKPGADLLFRVLDEDRIVAGPFVTESLKALGGMKTAGILLPNEDVSRKIVEVYKPVLEKNGVTVTDVEYFQPDTADFAPVLRKFQGKNLDGMLIGTNDPAAEAIVRQSVEIGGLPKKFLYRGGSGAAGSKYGAQIDGFTWQILTRDLQNSEDPKVKEWVARYEAFAGKKISINTYWGLCFYDTVYMLAKAMEETGTTTDLKALTAKIKTMSYEGVRTMRFDKEGRSLSDFDVGFIRAGKLGSVTAKVE